MCKDTPMFLLFALMTFLSAPATAEKTVIIGGSHGRSINGAPPDSAILSGRVTRATDATAAVGLTVIAYDLDLGVVAQDATDASGDYLLSVDPGGYIVYTLDAPSFGLLNEVFDNFACGLDGSCTVVDENSGDLIEVTAGESRTGLNFVLDPEGVVTGRVTQAGGSPVANVFVTVRKPDGTLPLGSGFSNAAGDYRVDAMPAGDYIAVADASQQGLVSELFDNVVCPCLFEDGTPISIIEGATTMGIDFELETAGGAIGGRVTDDNTGSPVEGSVVIAISQDLLLSGRAGIGRGVAITDANGEYLIESVAPGDYLVSTGGLTSGVPYVQEYYDDFQGTNVLDATTVSVAGTTVPGIDFALTAGGFIDVTLTRLGQQIGANFTELVVIDTVDDSEVFALNAGGSFASLGPVAPGDYLVRTRQAGAGSLLNELFDNVPCVGACDLSAGQAVSVTELGNTPIAIDLVPIPKALDRSPDDLDDLGVAVAIDGPWVAVGMPGDDTMGTDAGAILLYRLEADELELVRKVFAAAPESGARFGASIDMQDGLLAVGAPGGDVPVKGTAPDKQVFIMRFTGSTVTDIGSLIAANLANSASSGFGQSVSIDGDMIVVGAPDAQKESADAAGMPSGNPSGAAVVYEFDGQGYSQSVVLNDENGVAGDGFGTSIAVSGGRVASGAPNALTSGVASIFDQLAGPGWNQIGKFQNQNPGDSDEFGSAIALDGDMVLIGAPGSDMAENGAGAAFTFMFDGANFNQSAMLLPQNNSNQLLGNSGGRFGEKVVLSTEGAAIGASGETGLASGAGAAYFFERNAERWSLSDRLIDDEGQAGDRLGAAIAFDGERLVVGAPNALVEGQRAGAFLGISEVRDRIFRSSFEQAQP